MTWGPLSDWDDETTDEVRRLRFIEHMLGTGRGGFSWVETERLSRDEDSLGETPKHGNGGVPPGHTGD